MTAPAARAASLVAFDVNGEPVEVRASLSTTLLASLRDELHLTAAKRGCNQGVCGACTVEVDGVPVRACLSLALGCEGAAVRTLEGLEGDPVLVALQGAFARHGAFQCGFCTPGLLVTTRDLLRRDPTPDAAAVRGALTGNLCRCTGYAKIIEAVLAAADTLAATAAASDGPR